MYRVAAFIVNYNMPERADDLAAYILRYCNWPVDVYLIDNGSDKAPPAHLTNVTITPNCQTTGGWMAALGAVGRKYFAYWFLITSAEFTDRTDVLTPMADWLVRKPDAVGVHPALTKDSTTAWTHLKDRGGRSPRRTWMIDNIASLYRADWFDGIGRFDRRMVYAWGIDLETCWQARRQGKSLWIDERVRVRKVTDIGYKMKRMGMTADRRRKLAGQNMAQVLGEKYGPHWLERMTHEYVEHGWR